MSVGVGRSLFAERTRVAVGGTSTGSPIKKPICFEATPAGQHMMYHWQGASIGIPTAGKEIHLRQGSNHKIGTDDFLNATILEKLHGPSPIQSARHASSAITGLPACDGLPKYNPGAKPHALPPEPSFVPIPNLLTHAETVMVNGIPQSWDEAEASSGRDTWHACLRDCEGDHKDKRLEWRLGDEPRFDADIVQGHVSASNCGPAKVQQFVGASLREDRWEKNRAAILNGTVDANASFISTSYEHGVTLMLSNLPQRTKILDVVTILKEHGCFDNITSFHVPTHSLKTRSRFRGYVFVRFDCCEAALQCFNACHGRYFSEQKQCVVRMSYKQHAFGEAFVPRNCMVNHQRK